MQNQCEQYCRAPGVGKGNAERILRHAVSLGVPLAKIVQGTQVPLQFLDAPFDINPMDELVLIANLIKYTGNPFQTGFEVGLSYQITDLGLFGLALMCSKDMSHATQIAQRYLAQAFNFTSIKLHMTGDRVIVNWRVTMKLEEGIEQFLLARDVGISKVVEWHMLPNQDSAIIEVGFHYPFVKGMDRIAHLFGCSVKHNQIHTYISFDAKQLLVAPPFSNVVNSNAIEDSYQQLLAQCQITPNLTDRVKAFLLAHDTMVVQKKDVAEQFHMSERTLTRRLEKEEYTWRQLIGDVRIEKAEMLLKVSNKSIQNIAEEVGFSSVSSLSHAFTKSRGVSPSEFRKNIYQERINLEI